MEMKAVIADPKSGKCKQITIDEDTSQSLYNMKIGDKLKGELIGMNGYEFQITGGSDDAGFPMHRAIGASRRYKLMTYKGIGFRAKKADKKPGLKVRKTVAGNMVHEKTTQINLKVLNYGAVPLFEEAKPEDAAPAQE